MNVQRIAQKLLDELDANYLEVVLVPSRDDDCALRGGMIRAVQYQNADWYREFCGLYESQRKDRVRWRKFKTKIKRRLTRRGLLRLIAGNDDSEYALRLADYMRNHRNGKRKCRR